MQLKTAQLVFVFSVLVSASVSLLGQESSTTPVDSTLKSALQAELDRFIDANEIPGATLAVCLPDGQTHSVASGVALVEPKTPMPIDGQMMVGSTGKTFVSAVALQLVSEKKLNLDDKVGKYFDGEDHSWYDRMPNAETMTIRSLMNHTSGLPRYVFAKKFLDSVKRNPGKSRSPRENLSVVLNAKPVHPVADGWGYSDTNYIVLGLIIEKVTGNAFYDEVNKRLLQPFKLTHTIATTQAKLPGLVPGHIGDNNPFGLPKVTVTDQTYAINPDFEWCGGGYMSSVGDLARWMRALHGGEVLKQKVYESMLSAVDFRTGKPSSYGYGLGTFVWKTELGDFVGHAGMMPGYLTQIEYARDQHFSVAFQMNTDQGSSRANHQFVVKVAEIVTRHLGEN